MPAGVQFQPLVSPKITPKAALALLPCAHAEKIESSKCCSAMTKSVLLFGAIAVLALPSIWLLSLPFGATFGQFWGSRLGETPFSSLGVAFRFWLFLLFLGIVMDYVGKHRARRTVAQFATLTAQGLSKERSVTQTYDGDLFLSTTTSSGTSGDNRNVSVSFLKNVARSPSRLRVDVDCKCAWVFEIRRKSIFAKLLGAAGAIVTTEDSALDAVVVVQADDAGAVCHWLNQSVVRNSVLSLFLKHRVESLGATSPGIFIRCELKIGPSGGATYDAAGILSELGVLAKSIEL